MATHDGELPSPAESRCDALQERDGSPIKFQASISTSAGPFDVLCFQFSPQLVLFITESPRICAVVEAAPDDPVDVGTPTTYSTAFLFGKDELSLHLLARRLAEVLQKRLLLMLSSQTLPFDVIRQLEAEISRLIPSSKNSEIVGLTLAAQIVPLSLEDHVESIE